MLVEGVCVMLAWYCYRLLEDGGGRIYETQLSIATGDSVLQRVVWKKGRGGEAGKWGILGANLNFAQI